MKFMYLHLFCVCNPNKHRYALPVKNGKRFEACVKNLVTNPCEAELRHKQFFFFPGFFAKNRLKANRVSAAFYTSKKLINVVLHNSVETWVHHLFFCSTFKHDYQWNLMLFSDSAVPGRIHHYCAVCVPLGRKPWLQRQRSCEFCVKKLDRLWEDVHNEGGMCGTSVCTIFINLYVLECFYLLFIIICCFCANPGTMRKTSFTSPWNRSSDDTNQQNGTTCGFEGMSG